MATWGYWNQTYSTSTTSTSCDSTFQAWCGMDTGTSTSGTVWYAWTEGTGTTAVTDSTYTLWVQGQQVYQETKEAREARERQQLEWQKAADERKKKLEEAEHRAEQLLVETMTEEQERAWKEERAVFVTGHKTGKRYKILPGSHGNIREIDHTGKEIASLCVNVPDGLPRNDNVLAQKLMLEHAEE